MRYLLPILFAACHVSYSNAGLIVTVSDLSIEEGGNGLVDVFVRSDTGLDVLDSFGAELQISGTGSTQLAFVDPQPDLHLTDSRYLYAIGNPPGFPDSVNAAVGPPAGSVLPGGDTYIGGDGTLSGLGILVPTSDALLLTLEVTSLTSNPAVAGDTFTIGLNELSFSTFFYDPFFTPLSFTSQPGTVTVISGASSAVPEPATIFVWLAALPMAIRFARKKRKQEQRVVELSV